MPDDTDAPYLHAIRALRAYVARDPGRLHVPGHTGGPGSDPEPREAIGERAAVKAFDALARRFAAEGVPG